MHPFRRLAPLLAGALAAGAALTLPAGPAGALMPRPPDFDGDGRADVAIGAPGDRHARGSVTVLYGSDIGPTGDRSARFSESSAGVPGAAAPWEHFGTSTATGDFDRDGYDDLAVGTPHDLVGGVTAGGVTVLRGGPAGLTTAGAGRFDRATPGVPGRARQYDEFGRALASGDFDRDGYDDLAVGVPGARSGGRSMAGAVIVLRGSAAGLTAEDSHAWHLDESGLPGRARRADRFGLTLAAGHLDWDAYDDLAVSAPGRRIAGLPGSGAVYVLPGGASGLSGWGSAAYHLATTGIAGLPEAYAAFGSSLAVGDLDDDFAPDLVIGAPGESVGGQPGAGAVHVLYQRVGVLDPGASQYLHQDSAGVVDAPEPWEGFGTAVAVAPMRTGARTGYLVVGTPMESFGASPGAGIVHVMQGGPSGVVPWNSDLIVQSGVFGTPEAGDLFGYTVGWGDYDGDGDADLALAAPGERVSGRTGAGAVAFYAGSANPLLGPAGSRFVVQGAGGVPGSPRAGDAFGLGLPARG